MRPIFIILPVIFLLFLCFVGCGWWNKDLILAQGKTGSNRSILDFTMVSITGESIPLSRYKGKVILVVNTASKCGLTPQYKDLETLYKQFTETGLIVLGFPANNFLKQEPDGNKQILEFCERNYGVSFPMFAKISVKGSDIHPLYRYLTRKRENGLFDAPVKWNFQKFLIDREGRLVASIGPKRRITDPEVQRLLAGLLGSGK